MPKYLNTLSKIYEKNTQSTLNLKFYCLDLLVGQSKITRAMLALITNIEQTDEPTSKKKKKKLHVVVALNFRVYQTLQKAGNLIHTVFSLLNQFNMDNAKIQQYHNANTHTHTFFHSDKAAEDSVII